MQKTAKVCVERLVKRPKNPKTFRVRKNYLVHDENETAVIGDIVTIEYAGRKISKQKAFVLKEILKEAKRYTHPVTGQVFTAPAADVPVRHHSRILAKH